MSSIELSEKLLTEAHVVVTPGSVFGEHGEKHMRFSFATSKENIKKGIERIGEFVSLL